MLKVINLGLTILGVIIKVASNNDTTSNITDGVLRLFDIAEADALSSRKANRVTEAIADQISTSCLTILDHHSINEARKQIIIDKIISTIRQTPLTYELVFVKKVNPDAIYRLYSSNLHIASLEFDTKEEELIDHLLRHISGIIINSALQCPQFANHGVKYIISSMENLHLKIEDILSKIEKIDDLIKVKDFDAQKYERIYRSNIKNRYGWIRLLGANVLSRDEKRYQLSIAYVTLEMSKSGCIGDFVDSSALFEGEKTVWIEGDAGSGKTTFLQWLAITSASNNVEELPQIENTIPIMVELRSQNCKDLSLKRAVESIMLDSDCTMPANWLGQYLESGRAIIFIDGVDEVKPEEREHVLTWIEGLRHQYKKTRIFITSRPQVDKSLNIKYSDVKILPMNRSRINVFLDYWHRAVLVEKLGISDTDASSYKQKLSLQIDNSDSIKRLVTNPLLCAMICALNYKNGTVISTQRNALYDDCCKMLFGNRDKERDIHAFEHITLTYEEKRIILAQLAYWMMMNGIVVADKDDVIKCIGRAKKGLKPESQVYDNEELFSYFLERSGILRTPEEGRIDFIHKSFQEYLSAFEIHRQDAWGFIAGRAFDIEWFETLLLSMGFASERNSQRVIQTILKGNDMRSIIVAAACASHTSTLTPKLRQSINKQLANIIPPKTIEESLDLASAGEFVIPLLKYNEQYSKEENYCCLVALNLLTSAQVLPVVATHFCPYIDPKAILCINRVLSRFTAREIRNSGIEKSIKKYICQKANTHCLNIPESFLVLLEGEKDKELAEALSQINSLTITEYYDEVTDDMLKLFTNIEHLTVDGGFESFYILSLFSNTLKSAIVCDRSKTCDIYYVNQVELPKLEKFHFHSAKRFYIDGTGLESLSNIKELGLFFYNNHCQIYLDEFSNFTMLEKFEIFTPFPNELQYSALILDTQIKELNVLLPRDSFQCDKNSLISELSTLTVINKALHVETYDYDDPFSMIKTQPYLA